MTVAKKCPQLITVGVMVAELKRPLHRILHVLATRKHIRPAARAGRLRLYNRNSMAMVRHELNAIDARRCRNQTTPDDISNCPERDQGETSDGH